jgi:hypothetical protein
MLCSGLFSPVATAVSETAPPLYELTDEEFAGPEQPISFSHRKHFGQLKIECLYCDNTADKSQHASVPSVSVCMGCHQWVKHSILPPGSGPLPEVPEVTAAETPPVEAAPPESAPPEAAPAESASAEPEAAEAAPEEAAPAETAPAAPAPAAPAPAGAPAPAPEPNPGSADEIAKIQKHVDEGRPIEWVRVHWLPEYVQFKHKRHVLAEPKIECQECHGPVETMNRLWMSPDTRYNSSSAFLPAAKLEMGWCVDCHDQRKEATQDCVACHH